MGDQNHTEEEEGFDDRPHGMGVNDESEEARHEDPEDPDHNRREPRCVRCDDFVDSDVPGVGGPNDVVLEGKCVDGALGEPSKDGDRWGRPVLEPDAGITGIAPRGEALVVNVEEGRNVKNTLEDALFVLGVEEAAPVVEKAAGHD